MIACELVALDSTQIRLTSLLPTMSFSTTNHSLLTENLRSAGQLTVAFLTLYSSTFVIVLARKRTLLKKAKASGTFFDRYKSPEMQVVDRLQGNFLEWSPVFLGLLWTLAAVGALEGSVKTVAWGYVGLRGLYLALILRHGVTANGMNKALWPSTFPAYGCLLFLFTKAVQTLYF